VKFAHPIALFVALAAMSGFKADDTYTLKQAYKKDDLAVYRMILNFESDEGEVIFNVKNQYKILSVEEDGGYEMEETLLEGLLKVAGEEVKMDKEEPKVNKYDKDGKRIKKEGDEDEDEKDPMSELIGEVFDYEPKEAVKVGQTWDVDCDYGTIHATLEAKEKVGDVECLKVTTKCKIEKKDASGEVSGTYYVRASDFSLEKLEVNIENPNLGEGMAMKKIHATMNRE
jgi:hypothetical protein